MVARVAVTVEGVAGVEASGAKGLGDCVELTVGEPIEDVDPLEAGEDPPPAPPFAEVPGPTQKPPAPPPPLSPSAPSPRVVRP